MIRRLGAGPDRLPPRNSHFRRTRLFAAAQLGGVAVAVRIARDALRTCLIATRKEAHGCDSPCLGKLSPKRLHMALLSSGHRRAVSFFLP
jgi:hypothetical protein